MSGKKHPNHQTAVASIFCNGDILDISLLILGTRKLDPLLPVWFSTIPDNILSEKGKEKKKKVRT